MSELEYRVAGFSANLRAIAYVTDLTDEFKELLSYLAKELGHVPTCATICCQHDGYGAGNPCNAPAVKHPFVPPQRHNFLPGECNCIHSQLVLPQKEKTNEPS